MNFTYKAVLGFLLAISLPAAAQDTAGVSGKVTDPAGDAVADLKVTMTDAATGTQHEIRTAPDGTYSIHLAPGTYAIGVERAGQGTFAVKDYKLAPSSTTVVNIQLSQATSDEKFRYMFYGFVVAWLALVVYVLSLTTRERGLRRQIDDLRRLVESERRP